MRTRFAPSPTGYLHLGHAHAAKKAFDYARDHQGTCLLRIEDTDHTRCKAEFTKNLYADLDWLGFDWPIPIKIQSQHYPEYAAPVTNLLERGLAYPCQLTRSDIKAGQRPHPQRSLKESGPAIKDIVLNAAQQDKPSLPFAIRLNLSKALKMVGTLPFEERGAVHPGRHDARDFIGPDSLDPIIARKDIGCSYLIAGTQDDWQQEISHVVRGADLFAETPLQVLVQTLMGWSTPNYLHHGLVKNAVGEKLSKRNLDTALQSLRTAGQLPEDIWNMTRAFTTKTGAK